MYLLQREISELRARTEVFEDEVPAIFTFIMAAANNNLDALTR